MTMTTNPQTWSNLAHMVRHLHDAQRLGNDTTILETRHAAHGEKLWQKVQHADGRVAVQVVWLRRQPDATWGYSQGHEDQCPCALDCPVQWLDSLPPPRTLRGRLWRNAALRAAKRPQLQLLVA